MAIETKKLDKYIEKRYELYKILYLDLYIKKVKLVIYSKEFDKHIYEQIPYIVKENIYDKYDATIVLWKEEDKLAPDIISEYDKETNTYYYGVKDLSYKEFIKQGHFLVQIFYKILKTDYSSLVHGAVVGMNGKGVLLCARGQRGKSTLTVLSMFNGMEYVSDDYLLLEKDEKNNLFASPIYSIITLSPFMTEKIGSKLNKSVKLGLNVRGDKYVFNISNVHHLFKIRYPIKTLIFPEIIDDGKPFIRKSTMQEKGRAITQFVHSTTSQMNDLSDRNTTKKLINMVNKYECYYFGLSKDIEENSKLLKEFVLKRRYINAL